MDENTAHVAPFFFKLQYASKGINATNIYHIPSHKKFSPAFRNTTF